MSEDVKKLIEEIEQTHREKLRPLIAAVREAEDKYADAVARVLQSNRIHEDDASRGATLSLRIAELEAKLREAEGRCCVKNGDTEGWNRIECIRHPKEPTTSPKWQAPKGAS